MSWTSAVPVDVLKKIHEATAGKGRRQSDPNVSI